MEPQISHFAFEFRLFFRLFVGSIARSLARSSREKVLDCAKIYDKLDHVGAIDFVQKSSESELPSQFFDRFKIWTNTDQYGPIAD